MLKKIILGAVAALMTCGGAQAYTPSEAVRQSQREFAADRFGIFIHWGIYSMFGQGEWYLNYGPKTDEYSKAARGFYPADFNAGQWAEAIRDSGARYVCFTSRHHDGFSMWHTEQNDYNIVDGTPFGRDVVGELAQACAANDLKLHLYYSHLDWSRTDYPRGRTGKTTGRSDSGEDWQSYRKFMDAQLTELLTNYGPIRAIWFDGWWDHDEDATPFDWQLDSQYELIHTLQPGCMVGNNHHQNPFEGEDIQIFERDVPGENHAGYSEQDISSLPLETCQTMNGMWGYKVVDTNYKDTATLIRLLVRTAGMGANLLLNIGPQPNGELPATALERLRDMGVWMRANGETIYGTTGSPWGPQSWGTFTARGDRLFAHVISPDPSGRILLPEGVRIASAKRFGSGEKIRYGVAGGSTILYVEPEADCADYIVELKLK